MPSDSRSDADVVRRKRQMSTTSLSGSSMSATKTRTSHACDRCRAMRTKCSGGSRCTKCTKDDSICLYSDRKRERNKKDLAESTHRVRELEDENRVLLDALGQAATSTDVLSKKRSELLELLNKKQYQHKNLAEGYERPSNRRSNLQSPTSAYTSSESSPPNKRRNKDGENYALSSIGSPGAQGELNRVIDLDHGAGATGYIGKMSEMSWMQRIREYLIDASMMMPSAPVPPVYDHHTMAAQDMAYFVDDLNLLGIDEDYVDQFKSPSYPMVTVLTEAYFHSIKGSFYFIPRGQFFNILSQLQQRINLSSWRQRRSLAVVNLVWAIGSKWLQLAGLDQNLEENHLLFYARARALGLDHRVLFDHPDVEMVQGIGLLALYLLVNGSVSRARNILGHAVRHGTALGLHLKVTDSSISPEEREKRAQVWYSLFYLEILIAEITGRPISIQSVATTVPLDLLDGAGAGVPSMQSVETQAESMQTWAQYLRTAQDTSMKDGRETIELLPDTAGDHESNSVPFMWHIRLCQISDEIARLLYNAINHSSWAEVQASVMRMQAEIEHWESTLPESMKLDPTVQQTPRLRERVSLAMHKESLVMILNRPCLCDIQIEDQSERSRDIDLTSARICVSAALHMVQCLPESIDSSQIWQVCPWWGLLHYTCQAVSVLLIELCLDCQHFDGRSAELISAIQIAMSCLQSMSTYSRSAYRAWRIFAHMLNMLVGRYDGVEHLDTTQGTTYPLNWTNADEASLTSLLV